MNGIMENIGAVLTGVAVIITAVGTFITQKNKQNKLDYKELNVTLRKCNISLRAYEQYSSACENKIVMLGSQPPKRPKEADLMYSFDENGEDDASA